MDKSSELLPSSQNHIDGELPLGNPQSDESFHFFRGLSDLFNRKLARYLDIESTTACLLVDKTLHQISQKDFFPEWQQRLRNDFKIPLEISQTFQSPHIVFRRLKILANQIQDSDLNLFSKIRYVFSAPDFDPYSMPWLFYPFKRDLNEVFIAQLNNDGPAFQEYYLQMACRVGNLAFVQFVCAQYKLKLTDIHLNYASASGNLTLVKECIHTYNVIPTDKSLSSAVSSGNLDLLKYYLYELHIKPNEEIYAEAASFGYPNTIRFLTENFGEVEALPSYLDLSIIRTGDINQADQLVLSEKPYGIEFNFQFIDAYLSEKTITLEFVQTLINRYQFVPTERTLERALLSGHFDLVTFLFDKIKEHQPDLSPNYHACTITGDIEFVKQIIAQYNLTPSSVWLCSAFSSGNIDLVKYLIKQYPFLLEKFPWRRNDQLEYIDFSQFLFCHVPMAKFLIEELGIVPIRSEFEHYISGKNLPVAQYLFTKLGKQWGPDLFPNTAVYTDPNDRTLLEWYGLGESPKIAYYNEQMPFISLVASACGQDPHNPLSFQIEEDWHLLVKKAFLETYEFDGYDSTSEEYIPAFPDTPNKKYKFPAKDLTIWTALAIFFGIPNRPEKTNINESAVWTWRQYIRNFFGGWNPIIVNEDTDEDNIEGKVLLNLLLIIIPVKIGVALFKLVTIAPKTALNTIILFTEFLPLFAHKMLMNKSTRILDYIFIPIVAPKGGFFSKIYYYAKAGFFISVYFILSLALTLLQYFRTITSPEKSARMAWVESKNINGGPTEQFIIGVLLVLSSLIATISFWSYIVAMIWFFAIPLVVIQFPTLAAFFITVSHLPLIAPIFVLIAAKIKVLRALYSYHTIPLLVAPIALFLTVSSRLSDEFSNAWAQWIPTKQHANHKMPKDEQDVTQSNKTDTNSTQDNNSNIIASTPENLVSKAQRSLTEAVNAAANAGNRSDDAGNEPPTLTPPGPGIPSSTLEPPEHRFASALG